DARCQAQASRTSDPSASARWPTALHARSTVKDQVKPDCQHQAETGVDALGCSAEFSSCVELGSTVLRAPVGAGATAGLRAAAGQCSRDRRGLARSVQAAMDYAP